LDAPPQRLGLKVKLLVLDAAGDGMQISGPIPDNVPRQEGPYSDSPGGLS